MESLSRCKPLSWWKHIPEKKRKSRSPLEGRHVHDRTPVFSNLDGCFFPHVWKRAIFNGLAFTSYTYHDIERLSHGSIVVSPSFQRGNGTPFEILLTLQALLLIKTITAIARPSQASVPLETTPRKTLPHGAQKDWIGSETTQHTGLSCVRKKTTGVRS